VNRHLRSKRFRVLVVVVGAPVIVWTAGAAWDMYKVAGMTEKMKTVCAGRMLIDLPEEAQLEFYGTRIRGFDIDAFAESPTAFQARVAAREAEIRATPDRLGGSNNMESVREMTASSGLTGKMFMHGRYVTEGEEGYSQETLRHFRYEDVALEAHLHADGISIDLTAKKYDPDRLENLPRLVSQLVPNPANRIPSEPGFCFDRAYIRDPLTAEQGERVTVAVKLPSRPDIGINFDTIAGTKPSAHGLLERSAASRARLPAVMNLRVTNLRAVPRTISGLAGDELIQRVIEANLAIVYGFQWEVNGEENNVLLPAISLMMATGRGEDEPVRSSLSEPAALALWDKIVSSIRVRPAAPPKAVAAESPAAALGLRALAGEACPQSGWWKCAGGDGAEVQGGRRQYIRQGVRMPQPLLLSPQTLWEKIRGLQPSHEASAPMVWTLVDKRGRQRMSQGAMLVEAKPAPSTAVTGEVGNDAANLVESGAHAMTGNPCPASGWWRCEEAEALDGVRWFALGSLLPPASFALPSRTFGRAGPPRTIQRRASWRLVRLTQARP
jgi:hypothetical protein